MTRYLVGGWKPQSIAHELGISVGWVRACVAELRRCTGFGSTFEAVLWILKTPAALEVVMELNPDERRGD